MSVAFTASGMEKRSAKPNQIKCAKAVVATFARKEEMYVLLRAQMQSGKTGTFHKVARMMLNRRMVDRVYVISGSNETVLYEQAKADAVAYNPDMTEQITVIFRQDFAKTTMALERTLIIVEESHLDQNQGQQMDKFLTRHGLSLNGTTEAMRTNATYILSVSATPFSEVSGITHNLSVGKTIEDLEPGVGYRGVKMFLENRCVHENFDLFLEKQRFIDLILEQGNKWNLVRCSDTKMWCIKGLAAADGIECKLFTQDKKEIAIEDLEAAPAKPTIVFLKGLLRCGKVVPKSHIGLVWEDSVNVRSDTVLQSLLGRMCGYYAPDADWPQIFLSPKILKADKATGLNQLERYVTGMESVDNIMPTTGANLKAARDIQVKERMPVCPIRLGPFTKAALADMGLPHGRGDAYNPLDDLREAIFSAIDSETGLVYSEEQKEEIRLIVNSGVDPAFREWADIHNRNHFHSSVEAYRKSEASVERFEGKREIEVGIATVTSSAMYPEEVNHVYVIFQLKTHGHEAALDQRVAKTTRKEIFAKVAVPAPPAAVMAMAVTMTDAVLSSSDAFEAQLAQMLDIWRTSTDLHVTNCITSIDENPLSFSRAAFSFGAADDKFKAILKRLETRFDITFTTKFSAATKHDKTNFRLTTLSWI
jgi:hypothetical protein